MNVAVEVNEITSYKITLTNNASLADQLTRLQERKPIPPTAILTTTASVGLIKDSVHDTAAAEIRFQAGLLFAAVQTILSFMSIYAPIKNTTFYFEHGTTTSHYEIAFNGPRLNQESFTDHINDSNSYTQEDL